MKPKSERSADQKVETFSAPLDFVNQAKATAKKRGMTVSGFYRYCLALELGWSRESAEKLSRYMPIARMELPTAALHDGVSSAVDQANGEHLEKLASGSAGGPPAALATPPVAESGPGSNPKPVSYLKPSKSKRGKGGKS